MLTAVTSTKGRGSAYKGTALAEILVSVNQRRDDGPSSQLPVLSGVNEPSRF